MQITTFALLLAAGAAASPTLVGRQLPGIVNTASFDDVVITDPLLTYMPMPVYQGLQWQSAYAVLLGGGSQASGKPTAGVQPQSGSQVAVFKPQPNPGLLFLPQAATGTLTKTFVGSGLNSFDLKSFYFGCALTTPQSIVAAVQACTVDVVGYKAAFSGVAPLPPTTQSFVFFGDGYVISKLGYANVSGTGFDGLEKAVFTRRTVGLADMATEAVILDDVVTVQR